MAESVTFPTEYGGTGQTITNDSDPNTGLGNGGHRERFVPALSGAVDMAAYAKSQAGRAQELADVAQRMRDETQEAAERAAESQRKADDAAGRAEQSANDAGELYGSAEALNQAVGAAQGAAESAGKDAGRAEEAADRAENVGGSVFRYRGEWDASTEEYPAASVTGDYYRVSVAGVVDDIQYGVGDSIVRNDSGGWDHNISGVRSVNNQTGDVKIPVRTDAEIEALITASKVFKVEEITESQDWSKDPAARFIIFQGVAPGGSGARTNHEGYNAAGASGGQGGEFMFPADEVPEALSVLMGMPGQGSDIGSGSSYASGEDGGDLQVGDLFVLRGGLKGYARVTSSGFRITPPAGAVYGSLSVSDTSPDLFGLQHLFSPASGHGGGGTVNTYISPGGNSINGGAGGAGIDPRSSRGFPGGVSQLAGDGGDSTNVSGDRGGDGEYPGGGGAAAYNAKPGNGGAGRLKIIQLG